MAFVHDPLDGLWLKASLFLILGDKHRASERHHYTPVPGSALGSATVWRGHTPAAARQPDASSLRDDWRTAELISLKPTCNYSNSTALSTPQSPLHHLLFSFYSFFTFFTPSAPPRHKPRIARNYSRMQTSRHVDNAKSVCHGIRDAGSWILETFNHQLTTDTG